MNSIARAGHLSPYFKHTTSVVSNGLKPAVVVFTPSDKLVLQPLPKASTPHAMHGSLAIQGLKVKCGTKREYCETSSCRIKPENSRKSYYITLVIFSCCASAIRS